MVEIQVPLYLKAEDVTDGVVAKIVNAGRVRTPEETGFDNSVLEIGLEIMGIEYAWSVNATSQRNIASAWGRDTDNWVGKNIRLHKSVANVFGKQKVVIFADPVKENDK